MKNYDFEDAFKFAYNQGFKEGIKYIENKSILCDDLKEYLSLEYYDYLEKYDGVLDPKFDFSDIEQAYYTAFEKGYRCFNLKLILDQLYKECEHGDQEHRDWLKNKFDNFYKTIIKNE